MRRLPSTVGRRAMQAALAAVLSLLLLSARGWAQNSPVPAAEDRSAWSSSLPFDLEPKIAQASFNLRRPTLHALYDAIGSSYGVKLLYDTDLADRPLSGDFRLENASLKEALSAAASISRTFVAPLDPHTGIVAADTPERRGQYERQILGSFHMDNQLTVQQLTEVSTALRNIVDLRRVTQDARSNWITVLGRSRQVASAGQLVQTLDIANGEVMLEIQVWEISTSRARDLGILPPQPFALQFLGKDLKTPLIPLLQWGQVQTLYGLQIAGLTAFLNSSSSLVRFHQTLHLRATDAEEASLLIGTRIPVVTGIVSSVIQATDTSTANVSANTQGFVPGIQYQDVGVVVHATPHLHARGEMTLQLDFALRGLGPTTANGIPSFTNRQLTSQVRLGSGEGYLLGGILTRSDQNGQTGYPLLSRIPLLGWLFSHRNRQSSETELLMLIKPAILRRAAADQFASRAIFFGKELTGLPNPVEAPPQPPAQPFPGGPPPQPGFPPQPGVPPQPGAAPQPIPLPAGAFPQGIPTQPGGAPIQQQPPQQPQQPANNPEE